MLTVFTKSTGCTYSNSALLLSFEWDPRHAHYSCGIQRRVSKLPLDTLHYAQVCQGQIPRTCLMCTLYFSDVPFKKFPISFTCKNPRGKHCAQSIPKPRSSTFRQPFRQLTLTLLPLQCQLQVFCRLTQNKSQLSKVRWSRTCSNLCLVHFFHQPASALFLPELRICLLLIHLFLTTSTACNWMLQQRNF